ncbi:MAG: response regulator transcription factor [Chloroflexi bacterium]|nr:response regulator transcription factor [Chloroflexota bacterium]
MTVSIMLADEADLVLKGIQSILQDYPKFDIIHSTRSAEDLLDAAQHFQPEIILFNERLDPLIDVLALVERLKQAAPNARFIVIGGQVDGLLVRDLFACGVSGYLFSGDDLCNCLIATLTTVLNNRPYLSPTANAEYLVAMQSSTRNWKLDSEARAVLRLMAHGLHVNDIAAQMAVPVRRIYWVRQKLRKRFGANTNEHLISMAVTEGFASTDH